VLARFCHSVGQPERIDEILQIKKDAMKASISRGNPPDDYKKAAGQIYNNLRSALQLTGSGSDWNAFSRDFLAPLLQPGMHVYDVLKEDIFGSS
jgi:hypothetical protein